MVFIKNSMRDEIYRDKKEKIEPFEFNKEVAHAFDDMAGRSIPLYYESQNALAQIIVRSYRHRGIVYDLGCSTGNSLQAILAHPKGNQIKMVGIDSSINMCRKAKQNLGKFKTASKIPILCQNILCSPLVNAEIVLLNYVCQFLKPSEKEEILKNIYLALPQGGKIIVCEKLRFENKEISDTFTDIYYQFKKSKGYSQLEISQKRDALENVLLPLTLNELQSLLQSAGFKTMEIFYKWFNFAGIIAFK